jgi:hypothetical protein
MTRAKSSRRPRLSCSNRDDVLLGVFAEGLAQLTDRCGEHMLDGDEACPDCVEEFALGDHLADVVQQHGEHLQRLLLDLNRLPADPQFEAGLVELDAAEAPAIALALGGWQCTHRDVEACRRLCRASSP